MFSGATSTQQRYEAGFRSISFVATVGAGYRLSRSFVVGARALGGLALDPSWESRIPGSGLSGYAVLGAEAFGRSLLVGNEGPVIEVAIGYAQFRFAAEPDAFLVQGGIEDTGAFRALPGFAAAAAIGWVFVQGPWTIEPRVGLRYFHAGSEHASVSAWFPSAGVSIGLGGK